jgi:orotate phosphoribosyltransferase
MKAMQSVDEDGLAAQFVQFAIECGVLKFGEFKTKAGRLSPYFFNAGLFNDGEKLARLAEFYVSRILSSDLEFDMIFGPAYKGIPLGAAICVELAKRGRNVPFAYNRKEEKDHGEGGIIVGAPLQGRVLIVDDVISAGTAVRQSVQMIERAGAKAYAIAIALDRQERATKEQGEDVKELQSSAIEFIQTEMGLRVCTVALLEDLLRYLENAKDPSLKAHLSRVANYRQMYGVQS